MADYTRTNLLSDVPDVAADRGMEMEAHFGRKHIDSEHLGVSLFRLGPNFRIPFGHRHSTEEEVYVVIAGSGRARVGEETIELGTWDALRVTPTAARSLEAGPDGMELVAVGSDKTGDSGEMIQDFWPAG